MTDWRFTFPDDAAELRYWVRSRLHEIETGQLRHASECMVRFPMWLQWRTWRGVPDQVIDGIGKRVAAARVAAVGDDARNARSGSCMGRWRCCEAGRVA